MSQRRFIVIRQDGYSETEILEAQSLQELHEKLGEKAGQRNIEKEVSRADSIEELKDALGFRKA